MRQEDGAIVAEVTFTEAQQGPPGYVHGGASAAVLDEAMDAAVWRVGQGYDQMPGRVDAMAASSRLPSL